MVVFGSAFVLALAPYRRRSVVLLDIRPHTSERVKERKVKLKNEDREKRSGLSFGTSLRVPPGTKYLREE